MPPLPHDGAVWGSLLKTKLVLQRSRNLRTYIASIQVCVARPAALSTVLVCKKTNHHDTHPTLSACPPWQCPQRQFGTRRCAYRVSPISRSRLCKADFASWAIPATRSLHHDRPTCKPCPASMCRTNSAGLRRFGPKVFVKSCCRIGSASNIRVTCSMRQLCFIQLFLRCDSCACIT